MRELERLTGMRGAFGPGFRALGGAFGNAVLTRGEIISSRTYELPSIGEPRSLLRATIRLDGGELDVFVTHLSPWGRLTRATRRRQAECLERLVGASGRPWVIVGDLNAAAESDDLAPLMRSLGARPAGGLSAATHKITGQHLDFIIVDPGWTIVSTRILNVDPSDHRPVVSELVRGGTQ
jgi:endonuclease/exonuclease/phosphatase family metal-dependent hydrolase